MVNSNVNILSDYATAMRFRKLSAFTLDLGKGNLKQAGSNTVMNIADNFIEFVYAAYGFLIHKIGKYGSISFYYMSFSDANKIYVFFDKQENELHIPQDMQDSQLEEWLSNKLYEIQEKIITTNGA